MSTRKSQRYHESRYPRLGHRNIQIKEIRLIGIRLLVTNAQVSKDELPINTRK